MSKHKNYLRRMRKKIRALKGTNHLPQPNVNTDLIPPDSRAPTPSGPQAPQPKFKARAFFKHFSGPLPAPEVMHEYNLVAPGFAERIMKTFEQQTSHRHDLERQVIRSGVRRQYIGQGLAFVVAIAGFIAAVFIAREGHGFAAGTIGTVDLVGLVGVFIYGSARQGDELAEKRAGDGASRK